MLCSSLNTTLYAPNRRRLSRESGSFSNARVLPRARGAIPYALGDRGHRGIYGGRMSDGSNCCSRGLRLHGARGYGQRRPWLLPTAALLILLVYSRGKTGAVLALMLGWSSFFPQAPPINGRC